MPAHTFQTNFQPMHDAVIYNGHISNHTIRKKLIQRAVGRIPNVKPHLVKHLQYKQVSQGTKDPHMQDLKYEGPKFNNNA